MRLDATAMAASRGARRKAAIYICLAILVMLPVLSVSVPVLGDFPNHLARIHILERLTPGSRLALFYQRPARLVPYQAMDVVVGGLRRFLPLYAAGRVFAALCLLVPPAAAACVRYMTLGRVGLMPAAGFLLSYNFLFARGFLDYIFAVGLALGLFALWLALAGRSRWLRGGVCGAGLALVFLGHAYGGVVYCLLVAGDQIGRALRHPFQPAATLALDAAAAAAQTLPCVVLALGFGASGSFGGAAQTHYGTLIGKLGALFTPVLFPAPGWVMGIFLLVPILGIAALATGRVRLAPTLIGPLVAVAMAAAAAPSVLFNAWATDMRLPIVLYILALAAFTTTPAFGRVDGRIFLAALGLLVAVRAAGALLLLQQLDRQSAEIHGVVQALPRGARLLVVDDADNRAPLRVTDYLFTDHLGLLATMERDAFVPFLLTGATPVDVTPSYASSASPNARPVTLEQLRDGASRGDAPGTQPVFGNGGHVYWLGWRSKFDDLLWLHFGARATLPSGLSELASAPIATLYRIDKP